MKTCHYYAFFVQLDWSEKRVFISIFLFNEQESRNYLFSDGYLFKTVTILSTRKGKMGTNSYFCEFYQCIFPENQICKVFDF